MCVEDIQVFGKFSFYTVIRVSNETHFMHTMVTARVGTLSSYKESKQINTSYDYP